MIKPFSILLVWFAACLVIFTAQAEEVEWGDDWAEESPHVLNQQLSFGVAWLKNDSVNLAGTLQKEGRYRFDYEYKGESNQFTLVSELVADDIRAETDIEIREASWYNANYRNFDFRVGRQIVTWGTGDFLFLNDVFAKDWQSFFNGREDDYLKRPVDALRVGFYSEALNAELIYQPNFTADRFLNGEAHSFFLATNTASGIMQPSPFSADKVDAASIALRIYRRFGQFETAFYFSDGYYTSPSSVSTSGIPTFSGRRTYGASGRGPVAGGLLNIEYAEWRSTDDEDGSNPFINNSQRRLLVGYEHELVSNLTWSGQYYLEQTQDYDNLKRFAPSFQKLPKENRTIITNRLTWLALQQTLTHSLFVFYSPSDSDYYLRYSAAWKYTDNLKLTAGINYLNGKDNFTFFSQLQDNSNLYLRVNYYY